MKNTIIIILLFALVGTGAYIYLSKRGYSGTAIINKPWNYDLSVDCSGVADMIVTSEVNVTVSSTDRNHNAVRVLITAYDKRNNIVKEKSTTFERTLTRRESLTKPVMLPGGTKRCDCVIESSVPQ